MTGDEMLEHPALWQAFQKRLSLDLDIARDAEAIREFAEVIKLPPHRILSKMKTYCHPGTSAVN